MVKLFLVLTIKITVLYFLVYVLIYFFLTSSNNFGNLSPLHGVSDALYFYSRLPLNLFISFFFSE